MSTITSGTERWLLDAAAQHAASSVEAQGLSPAKNDGREAPSALPKAVAEAESPKRQIVCAKHVPLGYTPFPKQQAFHASPAKYRLFGGAAGPGKSKALLMEAILQAHEHPGANTLLLRRTFPELEQSLLLYFRRDVPRELYKSFNESKHVVTWRNNSTTRFGYCQSESDVYQYQGAEFLFIGIDELTLFTLRQWQFLTSRNRCPIPGAFPCMAGATNPGNIGHAWVKSLWIDKQPAPGMENPSEYDPADYDFIPARVGDNPVYAHDENYLKTLRALPSHLRRAFLDGDWEVFAGQYFDNFDCSRHVIRAESLDFKPWWPRWISIDWGFEHPAAIYWHCAIASSSVGAQHAVPGEAFATPDHEQDAADATVPSSDDNSPSMLAGRSVPSTEGPQGDTTPLQTQSACHRVVTYREFVTRRTTPRDLAHEIVRRSLVGARYIVPGTNPWRDAAHQPRSLADVAAVGAQQPGPPGRRRVEPGGSVVPGAALATGSDVQSVTDGAVVVDGAAAPSTFAGRSRATPLQTADPAEKIDAIYLSPDAFAHRTGEASIAEQMGDVFAAAGLPRPVPADDDRVGGWMLMYQMLDASLRRAQRDSAYRAGQGSQVDGESSLGEWYITDNCFELIRTLPSLVRDPVRVEDIEKCDGDDPADAARYGLKSRFAAHPGDPGGWRSRMPLADRVAAHAYSADPTIRAMQSRKFFLEESRGRGPQRIPFFHGRRH